MPKVIEIDRARTTNDCLHITFLLAVHNTSDAIPRVSNGCRERGKTKGVPQGRATPTGKLHPHRQLRLLGQVGFGVGYLGRFC
jgi:hypothetical protein